MDLFKTNCTQKGIDAERWGVCDDGGNTPAYADIDPQNEKNKWIALVSNPDGVIATFIAIDHCIDIKRADEQTARQCDGLIFYDNNMIWVELKDKRSDWQSDAIEQLEETVKYYQEHAADVCAQYKRKRAFACNPKHPQFAVLDNTMTSRWWHEYKVRLNVQREIEL